VASASRPPRPVVAPSPMVITAQVLEPLAGRPLHPGRPDCLSGRAGAVARLEYALCTASGFAGPEPWPHRRPPMAQLGPSRLGRTGAQESICRVLRSDASAPFCRPLIRSARARDHAVGPIVSNERAGHSAAARRPIQMAAGRRRGAGAPVADARRGAYRWRACEQPPREPPANEPPTELGQQQQH
jgi:hypothetical protein